MEKGIVLQLQAEAIDENVNIESLLRKAYFVARKLQLKEFEQWIRNEQNGYDNNAPDYRRIGGAIKAWNPYRGWIPVVCQGEFAGMINSMCLFNPISVILDTYKNNKDIVVFTISGEFNELLNKNCGGTPTNYTFQTTKAELHKIISAVRNKILEWSLLLEENGIIGDGLEFSENEIRSAKGSSVINNYTNNFYSSSDNTHIQQG